MRSAAARCIRVYRGRSGVRLALLVVALSTCSGAASAQTFDFFVDSVRIDGNVAGAGLPDGIPDFVDEFDDGSLINAPTSAFTCLESSVSSETGGFLRFTSADGANRGTPGFLTDNTSRGIQQMNVGSDYLHQLNDRIFPWRFRVSTEWRSFQIPRRARAIPTRSP